MHDDSEDIEDSRYFPVIISGLKLYLWKTSGHWEICLRKMDPDGYPQRIGYIGKGDAGLLPSATNLSWIIFEDYRNQGIMKVALKMFVEENSSEIDGFAARILKGNSPSKKLAESAGFTVYAEDEEYFYLKK